MASLKNIMNVDDDHPIKTPRESAPRFEPSVSTSNPPGHSTSSSPALSARAQIQSTSSHSHRPAAPEASPSTLPLGYHLGYGSNIAAPMRRQTATATDSMDPSYDRGQGNAHLGGPYAGPTSRPFVPTKLTPITGRVSRAKKGLAVHTCDLCRPPKTFTRAEHLRRHQLSHQPPGLPCHVPGCDKVFHRKDLLERHQQRHDQEERLAGGASRRSMSRPHGSASPARSSLDERASRGPVPTAPPFGSPPLGSRPTSAPGGPGRSLGRGNWSAAGSSSPPMRHLGAQFTPRSSTPECLMDPLPMDVFKADSEPGLGLMDVAELCRPQVGSEASLVSWQSEHGVDQSGSSSNYSTPPPSDVSQLDHPVGARPSSAAWVESLEPSSVSSRMLMDHSSYPLASLGFNSPPAPQPYSTSNYGDTASVAFPGFDDGSLYGTPAPDATARSLSPQVVVGQCSETLVTAPAALPVDRMLRDVSCGLAPETAFGLLTSEGLMPSLSGEAVRSMPTYLNLYWEKVHPMYPIIHRATFEEASGEHTDVLRCAMAAVATQFLVHKEHRINGSQLHDFAWQMSENTVNLLPNAATWPLPVMQAVLLCEYYARFRGRSKEAYQPSARFNKLYQMVASSQPICEGIGVLGTTWRSWILQESRRRLLAACFLLSVHGNWYYEQPLMADLGLDKFSPMMLPIALSATSTRAWEAANADGWAAPDAARTQMVGEVLQQPLTASDMEAMPSFDASILLAAHALQLPRRRKHTEVDVLEDPLRASQTMTKLFPRSPVAYVYLALHHTPLHWLLSVSGDSWVFNRKVRDASLFHEHQHKLDRWRTSGSAAAATLFAAKALKLFLGLESSSHSSRVAWRDISDFWGVYVCALICWAAAKEGGKSRTTTRASAVRWILDVAQGNGNESAVQALTGGLEGSRGVIGLARDALERDCLGGRSILFADAVGVLRKLDEGQGWR
ncbi:hypothetical protein L249_6318 [Ophiocordyceps polyrhachis-furcata BCC 54312]|uniref:C2H2-type domain-containing protein n=1 Tax=Ophiocordyceps polyrhachis-furcata BCC 54312 TaxID=1330021 RepID=A0A367L145_9HYPO|nr:hypothetical protein L249_6318 [Ophiocordyceps polyrhachis-furcata BCC 54312]